MKLQTIFLFLIATIGFGFVPFDADSNELTDGVITISTGTFYFGNVQTGATNSVEIQIFNGSTDDVSIVQVFTENSVFSGVAEEPTIFANSNVTIGVSFCPTQNIDYSDFLMIETDLCEQTVAVELLGSGVLNDSYYSSTQNLWGENLENALENIVSPHTNIGYSNARIALFGDLANQNGQVQCIYTGQWVSVQQGGIPDWDTMNTEHSWPQSLGADIEPMRADLHHLMPTMSTANSVRGNLPFGNVVNQDWSSGGSKRGTDASGTQVFEPRDAHKGDAARLLFYYAIRYGNMSNFLTYQEETLREWFWEDPVDDWEIARNNGIYGYQNNRNPFIDYPEFLDRILSISGTQNFPNSPEISVSPLSIEFDEAGQIFYLTVANSGNASLTISGNSDESAFDVNISETIVAEESTLIPITFNPSGSDEYSGVLTISSNDSDESQISVTLSGFGGSAGLAGDCNLDGVVNILDVVVLVNVVLGGEEPENFSATNADFNNDGMLNVLDVVQIVNEVLGQL